MRRTDQASVELEVTPAAAYAMLTDYDRYQDWVPGVTHSQTLAREGDIVIVELAIDEPGRKLVLELVHTPPRAVSFSQVDEASSRGCTGSWELADGDGSLAVLKAQITVQSPFFALARRWKMAAALDRVLAALQARAAQTAVLDPRGSGEQRRKILEVVKRNGELEVWFKGETFVLASKPEANK